MSKKLLISEQCVLDIPTTMIEEAAKDPTKPFKLKNILLQRSNIENHNGRVYPRHLLEREVEKYSQKVRERSAMGEFDHPDSPIITLRNVSHLITDIYMRGDEVRGDIEVLNYVDGDGVKLFGLIERQVKIGISSRGIGSLQTEGGQNVVQDDFELIAFDAVSTPSTPGAFIVEGVQRNVDNNLRNILHGILKDSYFK